MQVQLLDLSILTWLWHDAFIEMLSVKWDKEEGVTVTFSCEINEEEDISSLQKIGVASRFVHMIFKDVLHFTTDIKGMYSLNEVVDIWNIRQSPENTDILKIPIGYLSDDIFLHEIRCSGGSSIDVMCKQIWLEG